MSLSDKSFIERVLAHSLSGGLPSVILIISLILGMIALNYTPREEEPQIVVPMVDVLVSSPGMSSKQVERQVTTPLEKLLAQIPGVENVYSSSMSGQASVTLRFYVGEDREDAILNTYNKLHSNQHKVPQAVQNWRVNPVEVDDVPIMMLALYSKGEEASDYELRRVAEELSTYIQAIPDTSEVNVTGGRERTIRIQLEPESLAARQSTASDVLNALQVSNVLQSSGNWFVDNESIQLESGDFIRDLSSLRLTVVNVVDGIPVTLQDVATIIDGPSKAASYTWLDFAETHPEFQGLPLSERSDLPMSVISIAKQPGSNAVSVAQEVHNLIAELEADLLPASMGIEVLRDYGATANEKVDNLTSSLAFAVFTVVVFIAVFLGWRPAVVVGIAVPISYGVTLALDMAFGYTINRVTLFALILSLGLLVDDPITGVDNIERYLKKKFTGKDPGDVPGISERIIAAISEIKVPLIMSTITIVLAFIPLAFITGMMGPYMAPMAFNVPVSVGVSTLVAFLVTPWLASKFLKTTSHDIAEPSSQNAEQGSPFMRKLLSPFLNDRRKAKWVLWGVLGLFLAAAMLPMMRWVPLKLLPFDNKNEVQIVIDMPESATLEQTANLAKQVSQEVTQVNEVLASAAFVGLASPIDFNGMVRRYYQRTMPYQADLRLTLLDKTERAHQSHGVVLRLRELLAAYNKDGVLVRVVEVPPGPPVLSTLVAELYGDKLTPYEDIQAAAMKAKDRLEKEPFVVEVDTTVEDEQGKVRYVLDKTLASLSGISSVEANQALLIANQGAVAGFYQQEREASPIPLYLELADADKNSIEDLARLQVRGRQGVVKQSSRYGLEAAPMPLVALGEIGEFEAYESDRAIHHKDLKPVVYVMAELSGRTPAEVIADVSGDLRVNAGENIGVKGDQEVSDWQSRTFLSLFTGETAGQAWSLPDDIRLEWGGEGEWKITIDVFIDMGLAFMFALVGIFFVLKVQTQSVSLSLIIMSAIPLTIIGIMPGFAVLNLFGEREIAGAPEPVLFTATAMIGMIALAGIVVRNSLILVEFITQARARGVELKEALILAGSVRMRPVLLTAGTTMLGNLVIILDPVFSGLALAIIFGIIASTIFTLLVVPIVYLLVFDKPIDQNT
jgi:multidrug efflux pump subunit AcrB